MLWNSARHALFLVISTPRSFLSPSVPSPLQSHQRNPCFVVSKTATFISDFFLLVTSQASFSVSIGKLYLICLWYSVVEVSVIYHQSRETILVRGGKVSIIRQWISVFVKPNNHPGALLKHSRVPLSPNSDSIGVRLSQMIYLL